MRWGNRFAPYVSVAERKKQSAKEIEKLKKKGHDAQPVVIEGRSIANTFWGKAWCNNLETYSDYENRLPRGRSYVKSGAVLDLQVKEGNIFALVSGSSIYRVNITITKVLADKWNAIVSACRGKIGSLIELLQGKFSKAVMETIANVDKGLFPHPKEMKFDCSCPDWAVMCKHVAAVLYGVGARLDDKPEELFLLRQADHVELIAKAGVAPLTQVAADSADQVLQDADLSSLFDIDMGGIAPHSDVIVRAKRPKSKAKPKTKTKVVVKAKPKAKAKVATKAKPKVATQKKKSLKATKPSSKKTTRITKTKVAPKKVVKKKITKKAVANKTSKVKAVPKKAAKKRKSTV